MKEARYFIRLAERCYRLASGCTDPRTVAHLTTLGDEFLNTAAQVNTAGTVGSRYPPRR
jgi:hypothetical protein